MKARLTVPDFQRARDVDPLLAHGGDAERGVEQHRPYRADEDDEDRRDRGILDGVERQRHPGQRRDRLQHLDERIERLADQGRHADQEAERDRDDHREQIAEADAADRIAELDAEALVVRPLVVERLLEMLPQFRADIERPRHRRLALRCRQPHQLGVFRRHGGGRSRRARGEMPDAEEGGEQRDRDDGRAEAKGEGHRATSLSTSSRRTPGPIRRAVCLRHDVRDLAFTTPAAEYGSRRSPGRQRRVLLRRAPHDAFLILKLAR